MIRLDTYPKTWHPSLGLPASPIRMGCGGEGFICAYGPTNVTGETRLAPMPASVLGQPEESAAWKWIVGLSSLAGAGALAYHGYKRSNSVAAAVGWGILGAIFPLNVIAGGVAVGQGFGKRGR